MDIVSTKPTRIRVLLIDDDEDDYVLIRQIIRRIPGTTFVLEWCNDFDKGKALIDARNHDVYLIDYFLGERSGLEILSHAKPESRTEPFILLTGAPNRELELRSLQLSASDFLVKGSFGPELLSRTLQYAIGRKQTEQQRIEHLIELNRTKDEFISIASHQLRTPATGVKQYLGMLLEGFVGEVPDNQRAIIQKAYESNERQLRIVTDLLKVAQVDAGKVKLRKTPVALTALIHDVIHEQADTYASRKQTIDVKGGNKPHEALIDRDSIRMVIENILDNASKYSLEGTTVTVQLVDTPDDMVQVSIADQGVGIASKDQSHLFEKFFRIDNPLSTIVGGTGLGLYWAKKIVDLHEGEISYTSTENKGTTFILSFPAAKRSDM